VHDPISPPRRAPRRTRGLLIALIVALAIIIGLGTMNVPEYALTPGEATPVAPLVKIRGIGTNPHHDKIMLTDVYLSSLTVWQWITMHFQSHVEFVPAADLTSPGVPTSELVAQGFLQMNDSKQAAEVAAFRALGWTTPSTPTGAIVISVNAPSPANAAHVHVADEIVALNGKRITTTCSLIDAVHSLAPGTAVRVGLARASISTKGAITWKAPTTLSMTTAAIPKDLSAPTGCPGVTGADRSWVGVAIENGVRSTLPATVTIDTSNIGGPSAGLAMTLTLIDELSRGSLTGHQVVAATGTIDAFGNVGDVGGVAEKTVAVQRAGAKYFIVPQVEVATAQSAASPGLRIIGVTTLAQALNDLRAIGGDAVAPLTTPR
jgi:PDZ domain-containing protein